MGYISLMLEENEKVDAAQAQREMEMFEQESLDETVRN
jgi:hypothetical protein